MNERLPGRGGMLQEALSRLEADAIGIASVADLAEPRLRDQVVALLPGAKSIVATAMEIFPEVLDHSKPTKVMGEASPRDMYGPHLDYLNGRLTKAVYDAARLFRRQGFKTLPMPPGGTPQDARYLFGILSLKHAAEAAGLGTIGRHSLLVTPDFGPRVRLACVLTEAELKPTPRLEDGICDGCDSCIQTCPAGALSEPKDGAPYAINKYACMAFRSASGGCSECMRVCPQGR